MNSQEAEKGCNWLASNTRMNMGDGMVNVAERKWNKVGPNGFCLGVSGLNRQKLGRQPIDPPTTPHHRVGR